MKLYKMGRKMLGGILICALVLTVFISASGNAGLGNIKQDKSKNITGKINVTFFLFIGIIRDDQWGGGWTQTLNFHAVSVLILSNHRPCVHWLINKNVTLYQQAWLGFVGKHTICGIHEDGFLIKPFC
jgi:hypothetical protein